MPNFMTEQKSTSYVNKKDLISFTIVLRQHFYVMNQTHLYLICYNIVPFFENMLITFIHLQSTQNGNIILQASQSVVSM